MDTPTILVVDDTPTNVDVVKGILEAEGFSNVTDEYRRQRWLGSIPHVPPFVRDGCVERPDEKEGIIAAPGSCVFFCMSSLRIRLGQTKYITLPQPPERSEKIGV
jgi:hypothetical protein